MNFVDKVSSTSRPVVIFGASIVGKIILDALDVLNIKPSFFCDNDRKKQQVPFYGYEVVPFERLCAEKHDALVIVAAGRYFEEISRQLRTAGFEDIYNAEGVIRCINFKNVPFEKLESIIWYLPKIGLLSKVMDLPEDSFLLPRLNVVITSRCTLKCKNCSSLIGFYQKTTDFDTGRILKAIDRIFSCVDLAYHVELLGGEPFLNKDFPIIAGHLLHTGKILHIDVITNGTLVPAEKDLEIFKDKRISVVIDDYGELSTKMNALIKTLESLNVGYRINRHWAWADLGGFEERGSNPQQMTELFGKCNFNSCSELLDGRLYRCPRSSHGTNTGLVPEYKNDFIDVLDESLDRNSLKKNLKSFFYDKQFIYSCNHCDGNTVGSLTLSPAEQ